MSTSVAIVADDLTGAHDAAAQFAERGWRTLLWLRAEAPDGAAQEAGDCSAAVVCPPDVVAISTESRGKGDSAHALTRDAVTRMAGTGVGRLYLKIDSTLRGSVAQQIRGALDGWSREHEDAFALVCPSYPAMGRTVVDGHVAVDGVPLEHGAAARDPGTPVTTSALLELLPASVRVPTPVDRDPREFARRLLELAGHHRVLTVDAATDNDLEFLAATIGEVGPRAVPVGSAGLASALGRAWEPPDGPHASPVPATTVSAATPAELQTPGPVLVLVTSLHDTARRQEERVRDVNGGRLWHLAPSPDDLINETAFEAWRHRQHRPKRGLDVVLVSAPLRRRPGLPPRPEDVAARLATVVDDARHQAGAACVVAIGGDGVRALVDHWGCTGIAVHGALIEGVPHGALAGGAVDGLPVVTKAGGFGQPDTIVNAIARASGWACSPARAPDAQLKPDT